MLPYGRYPRGYRAGDPGTVRLEENENTQHQDACPPYQPEPGGQAFFAVQLPSVTVM